MQKILSLTLLLALFAACHPTRTCVENPKPDCICTRQFDPVCGCNNKTYGNACTAECAGITKYTKGACPDASPLESTAWRLSTLTVGTEVQQVPDNVSITIQLNGGELTGNGGCNRLGGHYQLDGNKFTVSSVISTKMYCEQAAEWESRFLERLGNSQTWSIRDGVLELQCGELGVLVFRKE